jgi:hypothetical protein
MFTLREIFYNGAASGPNPFSCSPNEAQRQAGIQPTSRRDWKLVANQDSKNKWMDRLAQCTLKVRLYRA